MNTSHITHTFRKLFFGALFFAMLGLVPSLANVVFDGSPGTAAPPTTLGPYTMTPFGLDNANPVNPFGLFTPNTTSVATPALACGGAITFNPQLDHRRVGVSFNNWSHGYTGDVYFGGTGANSVITITLPAGTGAFYFYAEADLFGTFSIKADANDGTTSGAIPVTSPNGARYFGFYAAPGCALTTITITNTSGGSAVTVGEFGMACQTALNQIKVSDQKPGSILVYPYYTSNAQTKADTRVTLTNLAGTLSPLPGNLPAALAGGTIYVHIFFLNGANCQQADMYACLTKGASLTFNTSTQDPDITGYIIAVAVNEMGRPVSWNSLIGNAFVSTPDVAGNYGAEAFAAIPDRGVSTEAANRAGLGDTARLALNSIAYDRPANQFAVEIQSPASATGQTVVHASLDGNIAGGGTNGVSQAGTGLVIRGDEKQGSFVNFLGGGCHSVGSIRVDRPRVPTGMAGFLPAGQIGTMVYNTSAGSVGLLLTPKANAWSGIRTLHKTRTVDSFLTIPVFMPVC